MTPAAIAEVKAARSEYIAARRGFIESASRAGMTKQETADACGISLQTFHGVVSSDGVEWTDRTQLGSRDRPSSVSALARKNGINPRTALNRIRRGWTVQAACTLPPRQYVREWQPIHSKEN